MITQRSVVLALASLIALLASNMIASEANQGEVFLSVDMTAEEIMAAQNQLSLTRACQRLAECYTDKEGLA